MSLVEDRPAAASDRKPPPKLSVIDCDIHPQFGSRDEILEFLPKQWQEYSKLWGGFYRQALADTLSHPRMAPDVARNDAYPPKGPPGSDLAFMQEQHLDANGVEYGMLMPLNRGPGNQRNLDFGAALAHAVNDWQLAYWCSRDQRLKASIVVAQEDPDAAVREIRLRAPDKNFLQIMVPPRTLEPLGRRRYWPIFEAAVEFGLPVVLHVSGINGFASTASGYPSWYIEEHHSNVQSMQSLISSLVFEGVFERFPDLRIVLVEGGVVWAQALKWRLDKHWRHFRAELPHLRRAPSEFVREHIYFTTQPLDEPERDEDLTAVFRDIGVDRIMFSTDYPHWDFDDPRFVLAKMGLRPEESQQIFSGNAKKLYKLP
ncbi:MAG: amidohydrolase family protein [Beijerinckiaceae bacterium]